MSGASALAAAKRRRSKVDSNRSTSSNSRSNTTNTNNISSSNNVDNMSMPQRLTVQQSFQYIWQKVLQVEALAQNNSISVNKNSNSNSNSNVSSKEINELKQKVNSIERSLQLLSNTTNSQKTVEVDGEKFVSVEQFNDVMTKVGNDMQTVSEKMAELSEFVMNVQNNNIVLRNMLDNMQNESTFAFEDGTVSSSGQDSKLDGESIENVDDENVDDDNDDNQSVGDNSVEASNKESLDGSFNETTTDINSVLDKLKTLNSDEIKSEVAAELNNNITLVVEENVNSNNGESSN